MTTNNRQGAVYTLSNIINILQWRNPFTEDTIGTASLNCPEYTNTLHIIVLYANNYLF